MDKYERLFRRAMVLGNWGYSLEFHGNFDRACEVIGTNEGIIKYYNDYGLGDLESEIEADLNAIDLIAQATT
jgi:hypothetical protein